MSHPNPTYGLRAHQQHPQPARTRSTARASSAPDSVPLCSALAPATSAPRAAYPQAPSSLKRTPCYSYAAPFPAQSTCPQLQPLNLTTLCRNLACRPSKAPPTTGPRVVEPPVPTDPAPRHTERTPAPRAAAPAERAAAPATAPVAKTGTAVTTERAAPRGRSAQRLAERKLNATPARSAEPRSTRATGQLNAAPECPNTLNDAGRLNSATQRPSALSSWQLAHAPTQAPGPQLEVTELNTERSERCAQQDPAVMSIVELK